VSGDGRLFCPADSPLTPLVDGLAWLWRLGPRLDDPEHRAVGIGEARDAAELAALVAARRLAGAVILAAGPGEEAGPLPARRQHAGTARFGALSVQGPHTLFASGRPAVRSSLGVHAVRDGGFMALGAGMGTWGRLDLAWALHAVARFLAERLERPLVLLPAIGCLRLDDFPGTAELQLRGASKDDDRQRRRAERMIARLRHAGARLVVAVAARALDGEREVPLEHVWPRAVAALARGVEHGVLEPACHGLLHLEPAAWAAGRVDPREFGKIDRAEAGRRLDVATDWLGRTIGAPRSFVAPAWGYGPGALAAASERGLVTWLPPAPGPLLRELGLHETLSVGLPGLHRLDYAPLRQLAAAGLPATVVFHGQLLDDRLPRLRSARDVRTAARLAVLPDLPRVARLSGVRWVGAAELVQQLRAHEAITAQGAEIRALGEPHRLLDRGGIVDASAKSARD
jgi:hypothetical protein